MTAIQRCTPEPIRGLWPAPSWHPQRDSKPCRNLGTRRLLSIAVLRVGGDLFEDVPGDAFLHRSTAEPCGELHLGEVVWQCGLRRQVVADGDRRHGCRVIDRELEAPRRAARERHQVAPVSWLILDMH